MQVFIRIAERQGSLRWLEACLVEVEDVLPYAVDRRLLQSRENPSRYIVVHWRRYEPPLSSLSRWKAYRIVEALISVMNTSKNRVSTDRLALK